MGRSWKEKPWKYKNDKGFQKKQKEKQKHHKPFEPQQDSDLPNSPFDDPPEYHESFA